jgi:hypothetical protein
MHDLSRCPPSYEPSFRSRDARARLPAHSPRHLALLAEPVDNTTFTLIDGTALFAGYAGGARLLRQ